MCTLTNTYNVAHLQIKMYSAHVCMVFRERIEFHVHRVHRIPQNARLQHIATIAVLLEHCAIECHRHICNTPYELNTHTNHPTTCLEVECGHLHTARPELYGIVVGRINAHARRIHAHNVLLRERAQLKSMLAHELLCRRLIHGRQLIRARGWIGREHSCL